MSVEIKVRVVGESITEGVLARWLKKNGETVNVESAGGERTVTQHPVKNDRK